MIAVAIGLLGNSTSAQAQAPDPRLRHGGAFEDITRSLGLGIVAEVRMEFSPGSNGRPGFFDVFTELSVAGTSAAQEGNDTNIVDEGITFELAGIAVATAP